MKKTTNHLVIFIIIVSGCLVNANANANTSIYWKEFLDSPNKITLAELKKNIGKFTTGCDWGKDINQLAIPLAKHQQLFELIEGGDQLAFDAGLYIVKCLDGGELGDFYRSVGSFFEEKPYVFFLKIRDRSILRNSLKLMLTTFQLDLVDDLNQQLLVTEKRVLLIKSICDEISAETMNLGLFFLEEKRLHINRILKSKGATKS